ncbi:MAG: hypothetical protein ACR2P6_10385 [Gammaproteobacteria bacterium]
MPASKKSRFALFFAGLCLLLALIFISGDSLAGVFAVSIIQPWATLLVRMKDSPGVDYISFSKVIMLGGGFLNAYLIYAFMSRVFHRRGA